MFMYNLTKCMLYIVLILRETLSFRLSIDKLSRYNNERNKNMRCYAYISLYHIQNVTYPENEVVDDEEIIANCPPTKYNGDTSETMKKIEDYHFKDALLSHIQNNNTSIVYKLLLIEKYINDDTITPNIYSGGLLDDFTFDIK